MRPFADVLSEVNRGVVADEAATELAKVVTAVRETGKKGTVRVTLEIAPVKGNDQIVQVSGSVDAKLPRPAAPTSFFYPDDTGNLGRNDPNMFPMFADREVPEATR